jgi:dynein heavy chain
VCLARCQIPRQVNAEATKIAKEAAEANAIKTQVQLELDKALPALQVGNGSLPAD